MGIVDLFNGPGSYILTANINIPTIPVKEYKSNLKSGHEESNGEFQWISIDIINDKYPDLKSDLYSLIGIVDLSVTQSIKTSLTAKGEFDFSIQFTQLVYLTDGHVSNCDSD